MKIFIEPSAWQDRHNIYIMEEDYSKKRYIAKPMKLEFEEYKDGEVQEPTLQVSRAFGGVETNFLQSLSNALAEAGYKPKSIEENEGELKATKLHLQDMRDLVFKKNT